MSRRGSVVVVVAVEWSSSWSSGGRRRGAVVVVVVGGTTLPPVRLPALIVSARKVPSIVALKRLSCAFWFGAHRNARTRVLACAPRATRHVAPRIEPSSTVCVPSMLDPRSLAKNTEIHPVPGRD